jgi:two-component system cell cycle response regulator DivK
MDVAELERNRDIPGLVAAVKHPDPAIGYGSVCALLRLGAADELVQIGPPVVDLLIAVLKGHNPEVCQAVARALGQIGDVRAVEPLIAALSNREGGVRVMAANALKHFDTPEARTALASHERPTTILHIEDKIDNRTLVRLLLSVEGYAVVEASNGFTGCELAIEILPDLILLDIGLPDLDGYEVLDYLKRDERTAHISVIGMTAYDTRGDLERALAAGFDGYISKLVDIDYLADRVSRFLKGREWE